MEHALTGQHSEAGSYVGARDLEGVKVEMQLWMIARKCL